MRKDTRTRKAIAFLSACLLGIFPFMGTALAETKTATHNGPIFLSNAEGSPLHSATFSSPAGVPANAVISKVTVEINGKRNGGATSDTYLRVKVNNTTQTFAFNYEAANTIGRDYSEVAGMASSFAVQVYGYGYLKPLLGFPPLITGTTINSLKVTVTYSALYTVTWKSGDVVLESDSNLPYRSMPSYDGAIPTRAADTQYTYYGFIGWDPAVAAVEEDVTYQAVYDKTVNKYSITWKNGDTVLEIDQGVPYGTMPDYNGPTPEMAGTDQYIYPFSGWEPAVSTVAGDTTYEAVFTQTGHPYTVTFDTAGGSARSPVTQGYGTPLSAPVDPTREGYTFKRWNPAVPASMPAGNLTCTAQWQAIQYAITFDSSGGSAVAPLYTDFNETIMLPPSPTRTGYTFDGWTPELPEIMPAQNLICTALWLRNMYSVRYLPGTQGTFPAATSYLYYNVTIPPIDFDLTCTPGYVFDGWDPAVPVRMPGFNTSHTALWREEGNLGSMPGSYPGANGQIAVTFDSAGGSFVAAITGDAGTPLTAPETPVKEGYVFAGWVPAVPSIMPEADLTCVAQWEPKVIYYPNNTLCAQGLRLRDIAPELTGNWQMFLPLDLSKNGEQTFPLIASNLYYAGEAKAAVEGGSMTVTYTVLRGVEVKSEFLAVLPNMAAAGTTDPAGLEAYGFSFGQPIHIQNDLDGDTRVVLYIMNVVNYNDGIPGLRLFTDRNPEYQSAVEAYQAILD